jgi:Uma2 family endonuclease
MAMPAAAARRYTVEEVLAFPEDGNRYELIRGELLVTPTPALRHQVVVQRLYLAFVDYLRPLGLHETVFCVPGDISWGDDTLVQPDLFVAPPEELRRAWRDVKTLLLAAEVLSPRSGRADRVLKRDAYREHGVGTYWIVDHRAGVVEVWRPDDERPEIVSAQLRWRVAGSAPELVVDLERLFEGLPED